MSYTLCFELHEILISIPACQVLVDGIVHVEIIKIIAYIKILLELLSKDRFLAGARKIL